jgi:hypothetical protein
VFGFVDERAIGAGGDEVGWSCAELGKDLFDVGGRFALFPEIRSSRDFVDLNAPGPAQQDGAGAFADDHAARRLLKRLDGRGGAKKPPFMVGVAKQPVGFLGPDDEAVLERVTGHQVFRHLKRESANGAVADEGVTGAVNAENSREMARRRVEDGLWKEQRAGGLRA